MRSVCRWQNKWSGPIGKREGGEVARLTKHVQFWVASRQRYLILAPMWRHTGIVLWHTGSADPTNIFLDVPPHAPLDVGDVSSTTTASTVPRPCVSEIATSQHPSKQPSAPFLTGFISVSSGYIHNINLRNSGKYQQNGRSMFPPSFVFCIFLQLFFHRPVVRYVNRLTWC